MLAQDGGLVHYFLRVDSIFNGEITQEMPLLIGDFMTRTATFVLQSVSFNTPVLA